MAIDITKLEEEQLLSALGDEDWVIEAPDGYKDFILTVQNREEILAWIANLYVRWCIRNTSYKVTHDYDPPWDRSGIAISVLVHPIHKRGMYKKLRDWLQEELTGQSRPIYVSGCGLAWRTYKDDLEEYLRDNQHKLYEAQYPESFDEDNFAEQLWDDFGTIEIYLEQALMQWISNISCHEVWKRFIDSTLAAIKLEKERAEKRQAVANQIREFWQLNLPDIYPQTIDMALFREKELQRRIPELLLDADSAILQGIMDVDLALNCSHKVASLIKQMVKDRLEQQ